MRIAPLLAALALAACAHRGTHGDFDPGYIGQPIVTPWGTVTYDPGECVDSSVTTALIQSSLVAGMNKAIAERGDAAHVDMRPLLVTGAHEILGRQDVAGQYLASTHTILYRCDVPQVVEHEIGHFVAHELGIACPSRVWHDLDLNCVHR